MVPLSTRDTQQRGSLSVFNQIATIMISGILVALIFPMVVMPIKHTPAEIEDLQETKTYIDHVACVCLAKAQIPTCSRHKYFHRCPPRWIYYARIQRQILIFDHQVLRTW